MSKLQGICDGVPERVNPILFISMTASYRLYWIWLFSFYLKSSFVHSRNELVMILVFFCSCLLTGDWNTYCMMTLLEDATVFITSIFYQYFITLLILYNHYTLRSKLVCLLIARYQKAVLYLLCCVLMCVLFSMSFLFCFVFFPNLFVEFGSRLHCGYFIATIWNYYFFHFVFNVNLWHDFEIKQENLFWVCVIIKWKWAYK